MTAIALTAAQISPVNEFEYEPCNYIIEPGVTITKGQAIAINTSGRAILADASTGSDNNVRGIATVINGNVVTGMAHGSLYGFTLSGLAYDAPLYLSNTAGGLDTAAGDVSIVVGRVKPMHDGATPTKVFYVNIPAIM